MLATWAPAPDLTGHVEAAIALHRDAGAPDTCFPAMARAMLTLSAPACTPPTAAMALFHTISTQPTHHAGGAALHAVGLVLLPAAAAQLLGPRVGALVDATLAWADLVGPDETARLDAALAGCRDDVQRLQALQASVRRALAQGPWRSRQTRADQLQRLVHHVGALGPRAAPLLGVGERQLERRCRALLGIGPKRLQRLVRFQGLLRQLVARRAVPDADAALAAGYFDQSHLAREARQLAGVPLQQVLAGAHPGGAWWPLSGGQPGLQRDAAPLRHHR